MLCFVNTTSRKKVIQMKCRNCKNGRYDKRTDTTYCRLLDRTLLLDRADGCKEYELRAEIKRFQEKLKG